MTSVLKVDSIQTTSGSGFVIPPAGGIIQIQYLQIDDATHTISTTADTSVKVDELVVTITPTSTSSVIKLDAHVFGEFANASDQANHMFFFYRNDTKLGFRQTCLTNNNCGISMATRTYQTTDTDSTPEIAMYSFFDTPSTTSAITYKVGIQTSNGGNYFLNRVVNTIDHDNYERGCSFISATEIAG